jgi:hypothetical protein
MFIMRHRRLVLGITLIAINAGLFAALVALTSGSSMREELVPYGWNAASIVRSVERRGDLNDNKWKYLMLLMVGAEAAERHRGRLTYIDQALSRFTSSPLRVVLVTDQRTAANLRLKNVVTVDDGSYDIHRAFRIVPYHNHGGIAVIDRNERVDFRSFNVPRADESRQLLEKYATGTIEYAMTDAAVSDLFPIGGMLPLEGLTSVATGTATSQREAFADGDLVVIFAASCAECQVGTYLNTLEELVSRDRGANRFAFVFDLSLQSSALKQRISASPMLRRSYLASVTRGPATGYDTRSHALDAPVVIALSDGGRIARVLSLTQFELASVQ